MEKIVFSKMAIGDTCEGVIIHGVVDGQNFRGGTRTVSYETLACTGI